MIFGLLAATALGGYMYTKSPTQSHTVNKAEHSETGVKNPMVEEKANTNKSKPQWESNVEKRAQTETKDTTSLIDKDTDKAKDVWKEKDKQDENRRVSASSANEESLWDRLSGQRSTGNPMVDEKLSAGKTKTRRESQLEADANQNVHDTSHLVEKDTKKVEHVWDKKAPSPNAPNETKSFWSRLFGSKENDSWDQAKDKLEDAKQDTYKTAQRDANRLSSAWDDAKDAASDEAKGLKKDAKATWEQSKDQANSVYDSAKQEKDHLKHEASNEYEHQKGRLNELHQEVSDNADRWKNQAEDKAKSWYQKGTDQVKTGLSNVKDTAQEDFEWAEKKVNEGLNTAKDEINYVLGKDNKQPGFKGHVLGGERFAELEDGQLRPTRDQLSRVPARAVVEHARGTDM